MVIQRGIRVSPKHGLNPTLGVCYWCGGETNTIGLVGALPGDAEAPRKAVLSHVPCGKCKALMDQGITLIEAVETPEGVKRLRWCVVKEEWVKSTFTDDMLPKVLEHRMAYLEEAVWTMLKLPTE